MRILLGLTLVFAGLIASAPLVQADDRADALAIVDDAIKAHGGADALAKAQGYTRKGTGNVKPFDKEMPLTEELTVSLPDRMRLSSEIDKTARIVIVLNGDKAWQSAGGPASEIGALRLKEVTDEASVLWLAMLTPLKKDSFTLKPLLEKKVNDKPAVGISVSAKGRPDVRMYFDKNSHLLVKIEREAQQGGVKVDKEYLYDDYKDVDGAKLPGKLTELINGKKFSEVTAASYKLHKPDDATFGKP
jgi:hypothetical protein